MRGGGGHVGTASKHSWGAYLIITVPDIMPETRSIAPVGKVGPTIFKKKKIMILMNIGPYKTT